MDDSGPEGDDDAGRRRHDDASGPGEGIGGAPRDDPGRDDDHVADDHGEEWRFTVDDVDEDGIVRTTIEPESPDPEHVLFVALGMLAMLLVVGRIWLLL